jgi:hypothetical protein
MEAEMKIAIASLVLVSAAGVALAAQPAGPSSQERIRRVIVYGADPCPRGQGEQIVICGRRPERDRYRIPKDLRDAPSTDPESTSWAVKAESMEYVGRTGIQSCSTVGPGGSTGCWQQLMRQAQEERRRTPQ